MKSTVSVTFASVTYDERTLKGGVPGTVKLIASPAAATDCPNKPSNGEFENVPKKGSSRL
jgi:hypothetical protein